MRQLIDLMRNKTMKRITVLGSFSGRNSGDAAILSAIVAEISERYPDARFEVPTTNPSYIHDEFGDNVKAISAMPWNLSLRLLGLPVFRSVARTDVTLITAGVLNDLRLFNPVFSFLLALAFLIPFAKRLDKKVVCYCVGVGPLHSYWGKRFTKLVCENNCDLIMTREQEAFDMLKETGVESTPMEVYADAAFNNKPIASDRALAILNEACGTDRGPRIGLNVSSYVGDWLRKEERIDKDKFQSSVIEAVDRIIDATGAQIVFVVTQMMDAAFAKEVMARVQKQSHVAMISLEQHDNHEIMGVLGELDIFVGMRLHSLILTAAMEVPIVGIDYHRKVGSMLRFIGEGDQLIELNEVTPEGLLSKVESTLENRARLKQRLGERIPQIKARAAAATDRLVDEFLR